MSSEAQSSIVSLLDGLDAAGQFSPDARLSKDELIAESQVKELVIRSLKQQLLERKAEHLLRTRYLPCAFWFLVGFIGAVLAIVILSGCCLAIPASVLNTMLATTTADIIGIVIIAFTWLFPKRKNK